MMRICPLGQRTLSNAVIPQSLGLSSSKFGMTSGTIMPDKRNIVSVLQLFFVALVCGLWEWVGNFSPRLQFLVGTPSAVCREFWDLVRSGTLIEAFLVTGGEAFGGLFLGTLLGSAMGLSLWYSDLLARVTRPFVL